MKTMPKLHKKKCVICQKEFMFRTGIAGRHKQIRRNYSVRFPISQTCSKKCHYVYEAVRSGIMKRINKKEYQGLSTATQDFIKMIDSKELLEKLADLEHRQWYHLINYLNSLGEEGRESKLKDYELLTRIDYEDLTEKEKEKDREWARKVIEELKQKLKEKK